MAIRHSCPKPEGPLHQSVHHPNDTSKEVSILATKAQYESAAATPPSQRTPAQQSLVNQGSNMQSVRNLDHDARMAEKANGE